MYPEYFTGKSFNRQYIPKNDSTNRMDPWKNTTFVNKTLVNGQNTKVLINPNFTRQVHVNPNFNKNKVFVNPQMLNRSCTMANNAGNTIPITNQMTVQSIPSQCNVYTKINNSCAGEENNYIRQHKQLQLDVKNMPIVKTKMKLIRVPSKPRNINTFSEMSSNAAVSKVLSFNKLPRQRLKNSTAKKIVTQHKIIRIQSPTKSIPSLVNKISKYKLVRTHNKDQIKKIFSKCKSQEASNSMMLRNRFKWVKKQQCTIIKSTYKLTRKAMMMQLDPQNTIIKNTKFKLIRCTKTPREVSMVRRTPVKLSIPRTKANKRNLVRINKRRLKKNNIPCEIFNKRGKCKEAIAGKCTKKHDPNQIQICVWFLQGLCHNDKCNLSHKVSAEKMPTCKFFLEGMCTKERCSYLHVKLSKNAPICMDFLHGFCAKGQECDRRHQYLCPDFERDGSCKKKRCAYPHGKAVRQYKGSLLKQIARNRKSNTMLSVKQKRIQEARAKIKKRLEADTNPENADTKRYYECEKSATITEDVEQNSVVATLQDRPKVGKLPSFISI